MRFMPAGSKTTKFIQFQVLLLLLKASQICERARELLFYLKCHVAPTQQRSGGSEKQREIRFHYLVFPVGKMNQYWRNVRAAGCEMGLRQVKGGD